MVSCSVADDGDGDGGDDDDEIRKHAHFSRFSVVRAMTLGDTLIAASEPDDLQETCTMASCEGILANLHSI